MPAWFLLGISTFSLVWFLVPWCLAPGGPGDLQGHATVLTRWLEIRALGDWAGYLRTFGLGSDAAFYYGPLDLSLFQAATWIMSRVGVDDPVIAGLKLVMTFGICAMPLAVFELVRSAVRNADSSTCAWLAIIVTGCWMSGASDCISAFGVNQFQIGLVANTLGLPLFLVVVAAGIRAWRSSDEETSRWRPWWGFALGFGLLLQVHAMSALAAAMLLGLLGLRRPWRMVTTGLAAGCIGVPAFVTSMLSTQDRTPLDFTLSSHGFDPLAQILFANVLSVPVAMLTFWSFAQLVRLVVRYRIDQVPSGLVIIWAYALVLAVSGMSIAIMASYPVGAQAYRNASMATLLVLTAGAATWIDQGYHWWRPVRSLVVAAFRGLGWTRFGVRQSRMRPAFARWFVYGCVFALLFAALSTINELLAPIERSIPTTEQIALPDQAVVCINDNAGISERWWHARMIQRAGPGAAIDVEFFAPVKASAAASTLPFARSRTLQGNEQALAVLVDTGVTHLAWPSEFWFRYEEIHTPPAQGVMSGWPDRVVRIPPPRDAIGCMPDGSVWFSVLHPEPLVSPAARVIPLATRDGGPVDPSWNIALAAAMVRLAVERAKPIPLRFTCPSAPTAEAWKVVPAHRVPRIRNIVNFMDSSYISLQAMVLADDLAKRIAAQPDLSRVGPVVDLPPATAAWSSDRLEISGLVPDRPYLVRTSWSRHLRSAQARIERDASGFMVITPTATTVTIPLTWTPWQLVAALLFSTASVLIVVVAMLRERLQRS